MSSQGPSLCRPVPALFRVFPHHQKMPKSQAAPNLRHMWRQGARPPLPRPPVMRQLPQTSNPQHQGPQAQAQFPPLPHLQSKKRAHLEQNPVHPRPTTSRTTARESHREISTSTPLLHRHSNRALINVCKLYFPPIISPQTFSYLY